MNFSVFPLWKRRSLAVGYWYYWLNAVHQRYSHPPFIDKFYQKVIRSNAIHSAFEEIELYRKELLSSNQKVKANNIGAISRVDSSRSRSVSSIAKHSSCTPKFGRFLFHLVQFQQSKTIIELGTSLGISSLYLSAANNESQVYTLEGNAEIAYLAHQAFIKSKRKNITLTEGNIDDTLPSVLSKLSTVDLAYIDANHRLEPTLDYFSQLLARTHENSVLIFDDIYWSFGMMKAWKIIRSHPQVTLAVDLFDAGLVFFKPLTNRQHYALQF